MKLTRYARLPLLLLFTLLQCVAPVAHAHVNGQNSGHQVHLVFLDHLESSGHLSNLPQVSAETDHSSVVSMPPEYRSPDLTVAQAAGTGEQRLWLPREYAALRFAALPRQSLPFFPYLHPCSQAPPA